MFYVLYQDNLEEADVVRVIDTDDGSIDPIKVTALADLLDGAGNYSLDGDKIRFSFIKENPLEITAKSSDGECSFNITIEDGSYICHVNGEEYEGECADSTVLAGFDCVVGKYVYFYLYDKDFGEGKRVKCLIDGYDGVTEVRDFNTGFEDEDDEYVDDGYENDDEYNDEYEDDDDE